MQVYKNSKFKKTEKVGSAAPPPSGMGNERDMIMISQYWKWILLS